MKICIATDAWFPQVNGVVRTLAATRERLEHLGHTVMLLSPDRFPSLPCPTYPEIRIAWGVWGAGPEIAAFRPDAVHIATEGPVGLATRSWCLASGVPFSTSFTTRFPEYLSLRLGMAPEFFYGYFSWFHSASSSVMVATPSLEEELRNRGFRNLRRWGRGVDAALFHPWTGSEAERHAFVASLLSGDDRSETGGMEPPFLLYVGRVAAEKSLPDFLNLRHPGTKLVVGDGPDLEMLRKNHPDARFLGVRNGQELARIYAASDVFVFPSRTDTFGIVLLEALASGVPVAARPVTGPRDILEHGGTGWLAEDLEEAVKQALRLERAACRNAALRSSWEACTEQFLDNLVPVGGVRLEPLAS